MKSSPGASLLHAVLVVGGRRDAHAARVDGVAPPSWPPGEANTLPPPVLPRVPTLAQLCGAVHAARSGAALCEQRSGRGGGDGGLGARQLARGLCVRQAAVPRPRIAVRRAHCSASWSRRRSAMLPLFLLLRELGFVNTYAGVMIPYFASIFGIFLVRQYGSEPSRRSARSGARRRRERDADLLDGGPARHPADPRHARHVHLLERVERLHVAAHRGERQHALHAAGRARESGRASMSRTPS